MSRVSALTQSAAWPILLVLVAMVSIQTGATIAKSMFPIVGAPGATALRLLFAAIILAVVMRPWRSRPEKGGWRPILLYGAALGGMNLLYYMALQTLPLGIAVALEFTGPLAVAMLGSRRPLDFLWVGLAVVGLLLLLPVGATSQGVDPVGAAFALAAGGCWALYIVFGQKAGGDHGTQSVAWGTMIAAALVVPVGVLDAGAALLTPAVIPMAIGVAVLSTALPYTLEMMALTRLPSRVFGTLMSVEPAIGALSGLAILGERLTVMQWAAIAAVVAASLGAAMTIAPAATTPTPD
ncbi:threonine/homoserine exporter RhtA [Sphingomonas cavernae]|uniref:Threonine/homoserine exporter RhtA n=1 Tax=Sphingomonas cavernae TaxID=2320861 RepID=A0A418WPA3_9SPHN|nr:threonine/homoserine exporter RhtA [Sphingomonas cavernae]RJF93053.1 threonine/homoserine exporter RhtA [Sphingomonas cavernae]